MTIVRIHPNTDIYYNSYYLHGLLSVPEVSRLRFTSAAFPPAAARQLLLTLTTRAGAANVCIDAHDEPDVNPEFYEWCDIYAKVNLDPIARRHPASKLVALGPAFTVRLWNLPRTLMLMAMNCLKSRGRDPWQFFKDYYRVYFYRLPEHVYRYVPGEKGYVFLASNLWKLEPETNEFRARFMRAARSMPSLTFEGGFAPRAANDIPGYDDLLMQGRLTLQDYLQRIQRSCVAFNTPAVQKCHGWKLGEFLSLGKAIISTPIARAMPAPLSHGEHVHYVDGSYESIREAIELIQADDAYRERLERNARAYYEQYLAPAVVIRRVLSLSAQITDRCSRG